jgi:HD superfamily phosphohydrolase
MEDVRRSGLGNAHLALTPRAVYTFNDFLLARYHMFLMVYFHHKSVIFEEMLKKYFQSPGATYSIPADIEAYVAVDDYHLFHHLRERARADDPWARRIMDKDAFRLLWERHGSSTEIDLREPVQRLEKAGIEHIATCSTGDLSKYTKPGEKRRRGAMIYAVEGAEAAWSWRRRVQPLEECTDLFARYEAQRQISRIYVPRELLQAGRAELDALLFDTQQLELRFDGKPK